MAIECISVGDNILQDFTQPMGLFMIFMSFVIFILVAGMGIGIQINQTKKRLELCEGRFSSNETDGVTNESSFILSILFAVVALILSIMAWSVVFSIPKKFRWKSVSNWILAVIITIGFIVCIILAGIFGDKYIGEDAADDTLIQNDKVGRWCQANKEYQKQEYLTIVCVMSIVIILFVTYVTDLITRVCVVYNNPKK